MSDEAALRKSLPLVAHPWDAYGPPQPLPPLDAVPEPTFDCDRVEHRSKECFSRERHVGLLHAEAAELRSEALGLREDAADLESEADGLDDEARAVEDEAREMEMAEGWITRPAPYARGQLPAFL